MLVAPIKTSECKDKESNNFSSNDFLAAICHELRTPISAIMAFSDMLSEDLHNPEMIKESMENVQDIRETAAEMLDLVMDLLDTQKIESNNFTANLNNPIDLNEVIRRSIKLNSGYAIKRNINIVTEIQNDISSVKLDQKRMKQILTNLISNAIKYSFAKTEVKITCKKVLNNLEIIVSDQGFGMNEQEIKIAFLKYGTIANQNNKTVDSFGLGLPIVKHLVELQNGEIKVESTPNKGTIVKLLFKEAFSFIKKY